MELPLKRTKHCSVALGARLVVLGGVVPAITNSVPGAPAVNNSVPTKKEVQKNVRLLSDPQIRILFLALYFLLSLKYVAKLCSVLLFLA